MTEEKKPSKIADTLERLVLFIVFAGALGYAGMNTCLYFLQNGLTYTSGFAVFIVCGIYVLACIAVGAYIIYIYHQPKTPEELWHNHCDTMDMINERSEEDIQTIEPVKFSDENPEDLLPEDLRSP